MSINICKSKSTSIFPCEWMIYIHGLSYDAVNQNPVYFMRNNISVTVKVIYILSGFDYFE